MAAMKRFVLFFIVVSVLSLTACSTSTTTTATGTPTPPPTTTSTSTLTGTWGGLVTSGAQYFSSKCAVCHGLEGAGGPAKAIIGPSLKSFETAQGLLDNIQTTMPPNAVSLPGQWYLNILSYMLVGSEFVHPEDIFNSDDLANVFLNE